MESVDAKAWDKAVAVVANEFSGLPSELVKKVHRVVVSIKSLKLALYQTGVSIHEERPCEICRGGCCHTGKYHFTVVDLLGYLCDRKALFTPDFENGRCPYLGHRGCVMEPEYRPYNCITFHCENIEELLPDSRLRDMYRLEKELRLQYQILEKMFNNRFLCGLSANYERACQTNGKIIATSTACSVPLRY